MAIEIPENLIELERSAWEAEKKATSAPYSKEGWAPWLEASAAVQAEITAHAEAAEVDRGKLEAAVKKAVRHPEEPEEGAS